MLIEVGPRSIGRCELQVDGCSGKAIHIVKKVLLVEEAKTAWVCHKCLQWKAKEDRKMYYDQTSEISLR